MDSNMIERVCGEVERMEGGGDGGVREGWGGKARGKSRGLNWVHVDVVGRRRVGGIGMTRVVGMRGVEILDRGMGVSHGSRA
jgi:hypothetical protein